MRKLAEYRKEHAGTGGVYQCPDARYGRGTLSFTVPQGSTGPQGTLGKPVFSLIFRFLFEILRYVWDFLSNIKVFG